MGTCVFAFLEALYPAECILPGANITPFLVHNLRHWYLISKYLNESVGSKDSLLASFFGSTLELVLHFY